MVARFMVAAPANIVVMTRTPIRVSMIAIARAPAFIMLSGRSVAEAVQVRTVMIAALIIISAVMALAIAGGLGNARLASCSGHP